MKKLIIISVLICSAVTTFGQAEYEVISLKINSSYKEYGARPYKDGIVFCSNKKNDLVISYMNEKSEEPLTQLYYSAKKEFGKFNSPTLLEHASTLRIDEGPFDFRGENEIYYTRSYIGASGPTLGIFISQFKDGKWSDAIPFEHNKDDFKVAHPALSADGNTLFFSANYPDSQGAADIYSSTFENGKWTEPVNLGTTINTKNSELYPTVHPDESLTFSSNRAGGLGGLDIYMAKLEEDHFSTPQILEPPFNSSADDLSYFVDASRTSGYFSSNRNGNDDLFEFKLSRPGFKNCQQLQLNSYCYLFYDEGHLNLDTLPLQYEWNMGDGNKYRALEVEHCFPGPGNYQVELNIIDTLTGDLFFSQATYSLEIKDIEQVYIQSADTLGLFTESFFDSSPTYLPDFEVDSYHWYFDDQTYYEAPTVYYAFHEEGIHPVVLGLRSKPDDKGLVKQACIQKDIVVIKGYLDQPLVAFAPGNISSDANENSGLYDYIKTSNDSIDLNFEIPENTVYRVEILQSKERISTADRFFDGVRGTYDVYENYVGNDSLFCYAVGDENELFNTYPIYTYLKSINYPEAEVKAFLPEHVYSLENFEDINEDDLNRAVFRTGAVYFESNNFLLQEDAKPTLDKILKLMERYPSLKLEVGAHTDDIGTSSYNFHLSQRRSIAVIEYLIKQNVDPNRLTGAGYGSELPIADNTTEEGRQMNRRVEFKVISNH